MYRSSLRFFAGVCVFALAIVCAASARAQMADAKEKPPMYTYVGNWSIPRAQWADMAKDNASNQPVLEKAVANGTLVGFGNDINLVHSSDGFTHDEWWSSMSMAGLLNVLDQFYKSGSSTSAVLGSATRHWDYIFVSRHYNWHSGSWKDAYTHGASYKLKADAPENALETLSKNLFVPFLEKQLADGNIHEYEIDTEAIHSEAPGTFFIFYIASSAEAVDKVNAALQERLKSNPMEGPAFSAMVDFSAHRDNLLRSVATYK